MKKFALLCLAMILLFTNVCASAEMMRVVNCDYWVSLRSAPSTAATRITTVPLGATVDAQYYDGVFMYCNYQGLTGYILASNLAYDTPYYPGYGNYSPYAYDGTYLKIVNCNDYVSLRSYASTAAPVLTTVPLGATVTAYEQEGSFTYCTYAGMSGYILSQYLGVSSTRRIVNCKSYVTLRSYASTSAPAVTTVPLGATVEYIGYAGNGFAQCSYNGHEGYILSQYLG